MKVFVTLVLVLFSTVSGAEPAQSPYRTSWSFSNDELSTIEVDSGDLSASRFASPIELATYLRRFPRAKKAKGGTETASSTSGAPPRELRIDQLDASGKVRSTDRWVASLDEWKKRLGERIVDRLEDEFDAHLRMLLPRVRAPEPTK